MSNRNQQRNYWLIIPSLVIGGFGVVYITSRLFFGSKNKEDEEDITFVSAEQHRIAAMEKQVVEKLAKIEAEIEQLQKRSAEEGKQEGSNEENKDENRKKEWKGEKGKRMIVLEEGITRLMLDLDGLEHGGNEEVKRQRKECIRRVQNAADALQKLSTSSS